MKKSAVLALGLCASLGVLSVSAYAGCGAFNQLVSQSDALQSQFDLGSNPNCSNKPDESVVDNLISCFQGLSGLQARPLSEADLQLSGLYGVITQCYRSGLDQQGPGKSAFDDLIAATQADPTYEQAWLAFSDAVASMAQQNWFERQATQIALGISIDDEVQAAIQGLSALPQDAAVTAELAKLRSL